jgi:hypothetical protein
VSERHTKHRPTKEEFYAPVYSTNWTALGAWAGPSIDADGRYGYITCYLPKDFDKLEEIRLLVLSLATLTPMQMRIVTDYCKNGEAYFEQNELENFNLNTVLNRIQELNIEAVVDIRPLEPGDYIGIQVSRQPGQNTNMILLGARIKYLYR